MKLQSPLCLLLVLPLIHAVQGCGGSENSANDDAQTGVQEQVSDSGSSEGGQPDQAGLDGSVVDPEGEVAPKTLVVNQKSGPFKSIAAAIAQVRKGDSIQITDSANYYESFTINPDGVSIYGIEGEQPVISGEKVPAGGTVVTLAGASITVRNLTIYVGGARYGINAGGQKTTIDHVSFDTHIPSKSAEPTTSILASDSLTVTASNFLGRDNATVPNSGIVMNSTKKVDFVVSGCDFWGIGTNGGAIVNNAPASVFWVTGNVFGGPGFESTISITGNGSATTYVEQENMFRNIDNPIKFGGKSLNASDAVTSGGVVPTVTTTSMSEAILDDLIRYNGCTAKYSFDHPQKVTLDKLLDRVIISDYFDRLGDAFNSETLDYMEIAEPRVWQQFSISWGRQYDPSEWKRIRDRADQVHARAKLKNVLLGGYLMEAIGKEAVTNTVMPIEYWRWVAKAFPGTSFRPLQAKMVEGRRWQGHWFRYESMLGFGVDQWGKDSSVPNLTRQEGLLYYLFLSQGYIDAGLNIVQIAQPQLTFGQNVGAGVGSYKMVLRFIKSYGDCKGRPVNTTKLAVTGVATVFKQFQNDSQLVDYAMSPAGTNVDGVGVPWNSLNDAYSTLPPSNVPLAGKPFIVQLDNSGDPKDNMSIFAAATPAARNKWLKEYSDFVNSKGYHLALPGVRPIVVPQNYTGYATPPEGFAYRSNYSAVDKYGGGATTQKQIFAKY